jgi:hypothetical protein
MSRLDVAVLNFLGWMFAALLALAVYIMTVYAYAISVEVFSADTKGDAGKLPEPDRQ